MQLFQDTYDIVHFAVAGQDEELTLTPGSHNISVKWNNTTLSGNCVTNYSIQWGHNVSESKNSIIVSCEEDSYVIEDLYACVEYEVSVEALNEENENTDVVTGKTRTQTVGNYHAQIILLYL